MAASPAFNKSTTETRDSLVMQHLPQVHLIARRIHRRLPAHISQDDLISSGVIGLLAAIDSFDESRNVQLKTYAEQRIRGAILDYLRRADWTPRNTRNKSKAIKLAIHRCGQRFGRDPLEEEVVAELKITPATYRRWLRDVQGIDLLPLEFVTPDGRRIDLLAVVADRNENSLPQKVERSELEGILARAIESMPKQARTILRLYYYEEMTLNEIATVVELHLSRVAQLRVQSINRLRRRMQSVLPNEFGRT
jgi:RNA polymerase sigma factor FliA